MKKIIVFGLLLNLLVIPAGYAQEQAESASQVSEVPTPKPPYIYQSGNRRDPFKPLISQRAVSREVETLGEVDIILLNLSGLIWDEGEVLALLHDGGNFGYILKEGRLLGANYQAVEGVYGKVKADGVYLTQGETEVKLSLGEEK